MNKFTLIGRLISDPETRFTKEGKGITTFTLAVNNAKDDTSFIKITTFSKTAELVEKYCHKGDLNLVEGMIRNNNYEDKEGKKRYDYVFIANKVEFLARVSDNIKKEEQSKKQVKNGLDDEAFREFGNKIEISDDEVAF